MLSLIIAESALERIPAAITGHPSVTSTAKKFGKYPGRMMLDKSWHFGAMLSLNNKERRGAMLAACERLCSASVHDKLVHAEQPLYCMKASAAVCTCIRSSDKVIEIGANTQNHYHRFAFLFPSRAAVSIRGSTRVRMTC